MKKYLQSRVLFLRQLSPHRHHKDIRDKYKRHDKTCFCRADIKVRSKIRCNRSNGILASEILYKAMKHIKNILKQSIE